MLLNIIEHTQDQPAALLLDSLGYQHNDSTTQTCNNRYIAVYRIPPNTTGYSHVMYYCLDHLNRKYVNIINYIDSQIHHQHFSVHVNSLVMHSMQYPTVQLNLPGYVLGLKHKSSTNTIKRAKSLFTSHSSSQP